jgi:hypothetical protein
MNAKRNKRTLTAGAVAAALSALLLLTGCGAAQYHGVQQKPPLRPPRRRFRFPCLAGAAIVAPMHTDV